jgi:hypothetical protein
MSDGLLQKELEYFKEHQEELVKKYEGKFLIIRNRQIQGVSEGKKKFELGTFLIQKCEAGLESYTQTFHSRVVFR